MCTKFATHRSVSLQLHTCWWKRCSNMSRLLPILRPYTANNAGSAYNDGAPATVKKILLLIGVKCT